MSENTISKKKKKKEEKEWKKNDSFETVGQIWLASVAFTERQYFPIVSLYFPKPTYLKIFDSQLKWIVYSVNLKPVFFFFGLKKSM